MFGERSQLWFLFNQLRRRRFPLGLDDYYDLKRALRSGFGWSSRQSLCDLCCSLWAKSPHERETLIALFDQLELPEWELPQNDYPELRLPPDVRKKKPRAPRKSQGEGDEPPELYTRGSRESLFKRPIALDAQELPTARFIFVSQYPLTYREVAQAWRRLRRPLRIGPPVELDIEGTLKQRCSRGVASPVVMVPRRRNTARLLLLVDRQGSMSPFHRFVGEVCIAIKEAGWLESAALYYFHDTPVEGSDEQLLQPVADQLFPTLDGILSRVPPLSDGYLSEDSELLTAVPVSEVLKSFASNAAIVLFSDAGAARGNYDVMRLLDTIAFFRAVKSYNARYVWMNPLPRRYWVKSTASQIARHIPMFPLNREGIFRAVNVLRGQYYHLEKPL